MSHSSKNWLNKWKNDNYVKKSKIDGYRSRAAYKLLEINNKYNVFKKSDYVLDLGAAPGGWSQVASRLVGSSIKNIHVFSIDLLAFDPIEGVESIKNNFLNDNISEILKKFKAPKVFDQIISDMSPNTTGIREIDHLKIMDLCQNALDFSKNHLKIGGSFITKVFEGKELNFFIQEIKENFGSLKIFKPLSSKKESVEIYLVAKNYKNK